MTYSLKDTLWIINSMAEVRIHTTKNLFFLRNVLAEITDSLIIVYTIRSSVIICKAYLDRYNWQTLQLTHVKTLKQASNADSLSHRVHNFILNRSYNSKAAKHGGCEGTRIRSLFVPFPTTPLVCP